MNISFEGVGVFEEDDIYGNAIGTSSGNICTDNNMLQGKEYIYLCKKTENKETK